MDLAGHHLFDRRSCPDPADLNDYILMITPDLHQEFHSWSPGTRTPKESPTFDETVRGDLFNPVNSMQMRRLQTMTRRLKRLQQEQEGQKVR